MKEIKLWVHDDRIYQEPHYIWDNNVSQVIREWKESVLPIAKEKNAAHFVYATKIYKDDELLEVNLYSVALDDAEFIKRTDATYLNEKEKGNVVWFGAWHKGTSY